jgi:hypothetical protein
VEGITTVEEHRVRHRRIVELPAAVMKVLLGHVKGPWSGRCAGLTVATGTGPSMTLPPRISQACWEGTSTQARAAAEHGELLGAAEDSVPVASSG